MIRLAAVQVQSQPGEVGANLEHAVELVRRASAQGAQLVVLPELFSCGYLPNPAVWDAAEPAGGRTARWLAALAGRLKIYLGAGSAETDGTDIFNVFILAGPDGRVAGRAYKTNAEASIFRRGRNEHLIVTRAGRIGIGICADNQFSAHLRLMHDQQADLVLMPHAWPTPARAAGLVSEADVAAQHRRMIDLPVLYARSLGVPVVFVNQVGPLERIGGILGRMMDPRIWRLRGQSRIIGPDGSILGQLGEGEGQVTADVTMDPAHHHYDPQPSYGGWLQPGAWGARHLIIPADIAFGRLSYAASRKRRHRARLAATQASGSQEPVADGSEGELP